MFDLDMIQSVYSRMDEHVSNARKLLKRPLTLSEKILYSHLSDGDISTVYGRGNHTLIFLLIGCMQDATAQMALPVYDGRKRQSCCSINCTL